MFCVIMVMLRVIIVFTFIIVPSAGDLTPGVDPRGVMVNSSTVIIGVVEGPWQRVIRPDKIPKGGAKVIPLADGRKLVELPPISRDYLVGYIYHVRVQEVFKGDRSIRKHQMIQIFAPRSLEGEVSLPENERFLLALAPFIPTEDEFSDTFVGNVTESLTKLGVPFDLQGRYYQVLDRNGVISITEKNLQFAQEIKSAICSARTLTVGVRLECAAQ